MTRNLETYRLHGQPKEDHFISMFNMRPLRRTLLTLISIAALAFAASAQKFKVTLLGIGMLTITEVPGPFDSISFLHGIGVYVLEFP